MIQFLINNGTAIVDFGEITEDESNFYCPAYGSLSKELFTPWFGIVEAEMPLRFVRGEYEWNPATQTVVPMPIPVNPTNLANALKAAAGDFDAVVRDAIGNRFEVRNEQEAAARAYTADEYVGEVPDYVANYAMHAPNGPLTAPQAAQQIIADADLFRTKQKALYLQMQASQAAMRAAEFKYQFDEAIYQWNCYVDQIRADLSLPG